MAGGPSSSPLLHRTAESINNSRVKEERETARSKLLDAKFNISVFFEPMELLRNSLTMFLESYSDPLVPRDKSKAYPLGVTSEMEQRWIRMIEESRQ
jgi:hypothetical protein